MGQNNLKQSLALATQQIKNDDLDQAIITLQEILAQDPNHEIATGLLASVYFQIGMHDRAVSLYRALLTNHPQNPLARFQLGLAQLSQGLPGDALATWEPMLENDTEFMAHFHAALALLQLGQPLDARERLAAVGRHMPGSHPLYPKLIELNAQLASVKEVSR
jgi:Tfp pilus assembly protein PilF